MHIVPPMPSIRQSYILRWPYPADLFHSIPSQIVMCVKAARGIKYSVIPQGLFIKPNPVVPYGMSKGEDEYGGKTGIHKRVICLWNTCMNFKNQYPRKQAKTERREIQIPFCHDIPNRDNIHNRYQCDKYPENGKGHFLLLTVEPYRKKCDTYQQGEGYEKREFDGCGFKSNVIIRIENDREEPELYIRGNDFCHGKEISYQAVPQISNVFDGALKEYQSEEHITDTHHYESRIISQINWF